MEIKLSMPGQLIGLKPNIRVIKSCGAIKSCGVIKSYGVIRKRTP